MLQILRAEALLMSGRVDAAVALACTVAGAAEGKAIETLPRVGRIMGKLYASSGDTAAAATWFQRSARVLAAASDECARAEVLDDYAAFLQPAGGQAAQRTPSAGRQPACLRQATARLTVHPAAASQAGPPVTVRTSPLSMLERAATVIELGGRPLAVGTEVYEMLQQGGAVANAAIVVRSDGPTLQVLQYWGNYSLLQPLLSGGLAAETIRLGRWRDRDVDLVAQVGPDLASRSAVVAARKIVNAGLALDATERERCERAALWPLDEPVEARHGVFVSHAMTELLATARKIAAANVPVLITGETGTGKEVLARIIHDSSPRAAGPFVPFNCAAVPREMLDSQLFGYRRGAFTGAVANFPGVIRSAAGGTLLLDEIGEVPLDLQPKLLRFLDAQEIQPLGEAQPVRVDVRVLAATNADLDQLLAAGRFREDLYYRLKVIPVHVPPLRERREEIPALVQHFIERFSREHGKDNLRVAEETMEYLLLYRWPGNVRELVNKMRGLVAVAETGAVLMPEHLPPEIVAARRTVPATARTLARTEIVVRLDQPLSAAVEHVERAMVPYAMRAAGGRTELAARMLGLSRKGLYLKRQRLGLVDLERGAPDQAEGSERGQTTRN